MQMTNRNRQYWATPVLGMLIGVAYLIAFWIGGDPRNGVIGFVVMIGLTAAMMLLGRRSETVRGLLDHRDERIAGIDLRATAVTAIAMIGAVLIGFIVEIAQGREGTEFALTGAVGGLAYVAAVAYYRLRG